MPKAWRIQWLSVKPARQIGATPVRVVRLHPRVDRVPERRLERRARAARGLDPLELVVALAEHPADDPLGVRRRLPGRSRESTVTSQTLGITFRFCDASIIVGDYVGPSSGFDEAPEHRVQLARALDRLLDRRHLAGDGAEERLGLRRELRLRLVRAEPLDQRRRLDERVVGDPGHRRMAAAPAHARITNGELIFSAVETR